VDDVFSTWKPQSPVSRLRRGEIDAGGDIAAYGAPEDGQPWRIGVRHPLDPDAMILVAEINGPGAVATSGTYERGDHLLVGWTRRVEGL
jgi:thiamine biosynthesis lipoprotein